MKTKIKGRRFSVLFLIAFLVTSFFFASSIDVHADRAVTKNVNSVETVFTVTSGSGVGYYLGTKRTNCWITNCGKTEVQIQVAQSYLDNVQMAFTLKPNQTKAIYLKGSKRTFYIRAWRYGSSGKVAVSLDAGSIK